MVSKESAHGCGYSINGPHETASADGEICIPGLGGAAIGIPTTSRSLLDMESMSQALQGLFKEAEEKFRYRRGCRTVLLIDLAEYVAGPVLVVNAINALPPSLARRNSRRPLCR